ncbi:putative glycosyltransferase EpsJ [Methanobrevibacter cuticularis]|uniref:Putative glycosyltransferase EpsJ n=1 Tax=Methanobrevibacter cuticularis TaxID=47311 RepID=A0A166DX31_9EURY|nr:glycosyltransferase family 2 protein [Methanobrevibacter cuticularis]KZX16043.1 putative glycosyltransferase EpsJ [Methanobrevibacter cuticularis]
MNDIKVSVIIPVYNVEKYLEQCLDSVVNQTLKEIEIICINDKSSDDSLAILEKYAKKDNRITIINNVKNNGGGFSRNEGLKLARGEYISFIDADDWVEEKMLEYTYNESKLKNLDLLIFLAKNYDDITSQFYEIDYYNFKCLNDSFKNRLFYFDEVKDFIFCFAVSPWLKLYKKELLDKSNAKFPEERVMHDNPFFYNIFLSAERMELIEEYFYYRRRHKSSLVNMRGHRCQDIIPIADHIINSFKYNNAFDYYKKKLLNRKIFLIRSEYEKMNENFQKKFFKYITEDFNSIYNDSHMRHEYLINLSQRNLSFYFNALKSESYLDFNSFNEFSEIMITTTRLENKIKRLEKKNEHLKNCNKELKRNNELIISSNSWKITKPIRKITCFIKKFLK